MQIVPMRWMPDLVLFWTSWLVWVGVLQAAAIAQPLNASYASAPARSSRTPVAPVPPFDLNPKLIQESPVFQRWLKQVPDVLQDIGQDPSFRSRLRLGYTYVPDGNLGGWQVGMEDLFLGRSGLTLSANYQATFNRQQQNWGAELRYYALPLGGYVNVAPVIGYQSLSTSKYDSEGLNVGLRLVLAPSRTGAADLSLTQSWVAPRQQQEVGITTLSFGYAVTRNLRLSTDIQKQNARQEKDLRVGIGLEWMF